jgi:hypothetical protein
MGAASQSPVLTHCDQKCMSKYLRNAKKLDEVDRLFRSLSIYVEKTGLGNFLPYVNLVTIGHPSFTSKRTVDAIRCLQSKY